MRSFALILLLVILMSGCTATAPASTLAPTAAPTLTPSPSLTPTVTLTPAATLTPAPTYTPTITATPTFNFPSVTVNKQAHCRYGPSAAYLHAADLFPGDIGTARGRAPYSSWLYIKPDKIDYFCWVAPSVVDVVGDVSTLRIKEPNIETIGESFYGPPKNVTASRDGSQVTIFWEQVHMTRDQDRGYFIEAFVCQDGNYLWWTFSYPDQFNTNYTVKDEAGCPRGFLRHDLHSHQGRLLQREAHPLACSLTCYKSVPRRISAATLK